MAEVGRNQPCPCGSGKNDKQCCLATDEAASLAARERLDQASSGTADLIHAGGFDDAERLCHGRLGESSTSPTGT